VRRPLADREDLLWGLVSDGFSPECVSWSGLAPTCAGCAPTCSGGRPAAQRL